MITRNITLYIGDDYPVRVPLSQYDTMWSFVFKIVLDGEEWTIPVGATAVLNGHKPDNNVFAFSGTIADNRITVNCDVQITAVAGDVECELTVMDNGTVVGTANFVFLVEPAPKLDDQTISTSALDAYGEILTQIGTLSGEMIPPVGTPGQVLSKASNDDYDTEWSTPSGGGGITDVTVASVSVVTGGVAIIPVAGRDDYGVVKVLNSISSSALLPVESAAIYTALSAKANSSSVHSIPSGGASGYVLKKASSTNYDVTWAAESGGGGGSITVDSTMSSTSENPVQNKVIYTELSGKYVKPVGGIPSEDLASGVIPTVPTASTATPSPLGTASAGSSTSWSRGDHVHALPSASDVGAQPIITEVTVSSSGAVTAALDANRIYHFTGLLTSLTVTLTATTELPQYHFDFISGSTAPTLTVTSATMPDGFTVATGTTYEVDVLNGRAVVYGWTT